MSTNLIGMKNLEAKKGAGRPKGALNKVTQSAKDMIQNAADELGGLQRMVAWVKESPENEKHFWTSIYPKLLPLQVNANVNQTSISKIEVELVGS